MTTLDLEPIKARLEAAAPGKWEYIENTGMYGNVLVSELDDGSGMWIDTGLDLETADAEFIAHAPEDMRALIAEVKAVRDAVARHPNVLECSEYPDEDGPIKCGWKTAYRDVVHAMKGAG